MGAITITDIRNRIRGLQSESVDMSSKAIDSITKSQPKQILNYMERVISNNKSPNISICMEMFDALSEKGSLSEINKAGNLIVNEVVNKVRDAKQTQTLIKMRLTRTKNKNALKIQQNISDGINDAIKKVFSATNSSIVSSPSNDDQSIENNQDNNDAVKEAVIENVYNKIIDKLSLCEYCDLILENYNRVSKRFNIDNLFAINTPINGVQDTIVELCNMIDTYPIMDSLKYNTIIETAWYGLNKFSIPYKASDIINTTNDYFLFKENGLDICKKVLENTNLFSLDEMADVEIFEKKPESVKESNTVANNIEKYCDNKADYITIIESEEVKTNNDDEFDDIFKEYKKNELNKEGKPENKLKQMIKKLYSSNVSNITKGTPSFLSFVRSFFILGTMAIPAVGPIAAIGGLIADRVISMHMKKKDAQKMLECLNNEIKKAQDKLNSTTDQETKDKLKAYIKSIIDAKEKISSYLDTVSTEKEQEDRYNKEQEINSNATGDNDDMDFDDLDFDIDFNESMKVLSNNISSIVENKVSMNELCNALIVSTPEIINDLAEFSKTINDSNYNRLFIESCKKTYNKIKNNSIKLSLLDKSSKMIALESAIEKCSTPNKNNLDILTVSESVEYTNIIREGFTAIQMLSDLNEEALLEASFSNTLKMAGMKLKNAMQKMSDKEKNISKTIDSSLNGFTKSIEKSLTSDNREAVIKGSILPSASKIIKLGILNAGLVAIGQPVIAIITTLGYLGIKTKYKAKERQMIIDEIEIELEMCKKYIEIAESKNDMKALKQLLTIQRNLQRQLQRIKYKMKVELGKKVYDVPKED